MPIPSRIHLDKQKAQLELSFNQSEYKLPAELLRVCSPSAEVQGHSPDQKQVVLDKQDVGLINIEAQGNYAIKLVFDDGHDSGIYTWGYLYDLCVNQSAYWADYEKEAAIEREKRESAGTNPVKWV